MPDMPSRPRYQEAFPRFNMVRAKAAIEKEMEICEFVDSLKRTVGHARMASVTDNHCTLEYHVTFPLFPMTYNTIDLELAPTPNFLDEYRVDILCPNCKDRKSSLVCVGIWSCASCHELIYRSQCVRKDTLLWEKVEALKEIIGYGRPKGMHGPTYNRLRNEFNGYASN